MPYFDNNKTCHECEANFLISEGRLGCATPLDNCLTYFDNRSCHECEANYFPTISNHGCYSSIKDCLIYSDNLNCTVCQDPWVLSFGNVSCVSQILGCANHSTDNATCLNCNTSTQLTVTSTACVTTIPDCLSVTNQGICLNCTNGKIHSYSKIACVDKISNCQVQTDDDLCSACFFGSTLSADKRFCNNTVVNASEYNKTVQSKITTVVSNDSKTANMEYLSKEQDSPIVIANNYDSSYHMVLDKNYIVFSVNGKNYSVAARQMAGNQSNSINILANLSSIPSSIYTMKVDLGFSKTSRRALQSGTLADYFVISYESPIPFFVGTNSEIWDQQNPSQNTEKEISKEDIFAIVFTIFGFCVLVGVICCVWQKMKAKKEIEKKEKLPMSPENDKRPLAGGDVMFSPLNKVPDTQP